MLPSLRLIVAGFLCGFVVVYAGLRLATSLNAIHQAFPITVAQAALAPSVGTSTTRAAVPLLYDMRFVASAAASAPVFASVMPEALERVMPPPFPADDVRKDQDAPPEPGTTVAAIDPAPAPAVELAPLNPQPEPPLATAAIKPTAPAVAKLPPVALEPEPLSSLEPAASEPEPATREMPKSAALAPETEILDAAAEAAAPAPPAAAAAAKPRAAAKLIRKRHRVVRRTAGNGIANPFGNSASDTYNWK